MDLVASCKEKLAYFRIKELKDVLTQLGLSKQGKKQDLVERILSLLSDEQVSKLWPKKNAVGKEQVAELVDDTYRKMQISGATTDLASKGQCISDCSNVKAKGEIDDPFHSDMKVRCLCGSSLETESMIKCEDSRCQVWQHMRCVIITEKPMEGNPPIPQKFYCELCRLSRADPFLVTVLHPLHPVKLSVTNIPTDGSNPVQSVDRTFQLTRADRDLLSKSKQDYEVQAWCMLLNDKVPFRMQWPQYADLQVNGVPVRAINRPGSQLLGANGRDDGPIITQCTRDGINKISLTGCDARIFCIGVRIVKKRNVQQILNLIPKESDGERFEDALARVCRCVGGGTAMDNDDSDSDLEVVADSFTVNLRCPMSGSRMKVAGRFKPCLHMGCFDLHVFVEMNQRSRKWQCPICLKNYALENVIVDPYFNRIASKMRHCGEDVAEIEVKPDGSWRAKVKTETERRELGELGRWHLPDSTLCIPTNGETIPKPEVFKPVKQEGVSEGHTGLKLGIRKNRNGVWEVSRPEEMYTSSGNKLQQQFGEHELKVIPMSSSATGSGRDGEDASVNQYGGGNFDFTTNNGIEMDSFSPNVDSAYGFAGANSSAPVGDAEVIVLSDSDEDIMPSETIYGNNFTDAGGIGFPVHSSGIADSYGEDPVLAIGGGSCLGLFNGNDDEYLSNWPPLPPGTQGGAGFQLFSSEADLPDPLVSLHHDSVNCSTSMNGYTLAPEAALGSATLAHESSVGPLDTDMNDGLVDNPLAFAGDDPSLQIFLPTRPSDAALQSNLRDRSDVSNGVHSEDWISLRLGGDASGIKGESGTPNGQISKRHLPSREATMNTLAEASLLLGMNNDSGRSDKRSRPRSNSPFSFPRQKRSSRTRLYLSIDSDSE
ncbi:E3 SUMO-protein ligase SIZ1 [Argentina anserina]|uniref:E3 SUMO-protein ligase SIZ1 n=1 Tax=Argentina anserina TaxID=57926 RepID=UPI0021763A5E|nr:E3 SUMO-protein ligase SIZ1 [Potentilla anserina]